MPDAEIKAQINWCGLKKQLNGFQVVNERFNKNQFQQKLATIIEETTKQLHNKRLNNFVGQMLMHHSLQSTKFMSKWIEEKNSNNQKI